MKSPANRNPWIPNLWLIEDSWSENSDTISMRIKPQESYPLPSGKPGQFNMLYCFGIGEIPISFSQISASNWVHTIRNVGKVSAALCRLESGSTIGVRGPYGNSWPLPSDDIKDIYIIAGGLGLAPVRPLIEWAIENKGLYDRITVIYGTRDPEHLLFTKDYPDWNRQITFLQTVDCGTRSWRHHVGYIPSIIDRLDIDPQHSIAYLCGPEVMMRICSESLLQKKIKASNIYLSMERNMKCAIGFCGHCQYGPHFICKDGPIYSYEKISRLLYIREV